MAFGEDAVGIEGGGIWISIALAGIDGTDEEIEVGVEHGLGVAGAAAAIDLDEDSGLACGLWTKSGECVLGPVERADHFAAEFVVADEFKGGNGVLVAFDFERGQSLAQSK